MRRSSPLPFLPLLGLLILLVAVSLGGLTGCEESPELRPLDNPFDPNGPTAGDGLQIEALALANSIKLSWNQPQNLDIVEYFLFRGDSRDGSFEQLAIVEQSTEEFGLYIYNYPAPTQDHWFKAQAITADDDFTLTSLAVAALAAVGPTVILGDTVTTLATRFPEFTVTAGFGDSLLVAFDEFFTDAIRLALALPGTPTVFSLDLGPAAADSTFDLYFKAFDAVGASRPTLLSLPVRFDPRHGLVDGNPLRLAARVNDLSIPSLGVVNMRFAASETELADAAWVPGAEIYPDYEVNDSAIAKDIWGEFEGDFGFTTTAKLLVVPNLLTDAGYQLRLPADRTVAERTVTAELSAAATEVRISENPDFSTVPWQPFAGELEFTLSEATGAKTVYVQYRNDWTQSTIFSDYCILVSQGLTVSFFAPMTGNTLIGGSTIIVAGTSDPGTVATAIDSVQLDLGDGLGFRAVEGIESWQYSWDVPTFTADTELVLRARAWAGAEAFVVTDVVTVTVSQLLLEIIEPLDGASVIGGEALTIAGSASGILNGAPIDSVVVEIGAERLVADEPTAWSVSWTAPVVALDTPTVITATMWVGDESVSQEIVVTVTP